VRWKEDPPARDVRFQVVSIAWDGKAFKVNVQRAAARAGDRQVQL
jgi:hypothetical protein